MTDEQRLAAWAAGDAAAGEALFERHFDAVARFFRNKVNRRDGPVDDLIQQTFLGAVEARDRFRGHASFRTFLFAVARNVLSKYYRAKSRNKVDFNPELTSVFDLAPSPSQIVAKDEVQVLLLTALRKIPLEYQVVLELHYWENLTAAELGAVIDVPLGTAKTRLRRAKQLLSAQFEALATGASVPEDTMSRLETWARSLREAVFEEKA